METKKKKYLVNGQKKSYVQYTKNGVENSVTITEGYRY